MECDGAGDQQARTALARMLATVSMAAHVDTIPQNLHDQFNKYDKEEFDDY